LAAQPGRTIYCISLHEVTTSSSTGLSGQSSCTLAGEARKNPEGKRTGCELACTAHRLYHSQRLECERTWSPCQAPPAFTPRCPLDCDASLEACSARRPPMFPKTRGPQRRQRRPSQTPRWDAIVLEASLPYRSAQLSSLTHSLVLARARDTNLDRL